MGSRISAFLQWASGFQSSKGFMKLRLPIMSNSERMIIFHHVRVFLLGTNKGNRLFTSTSWSNRSHFPWEYTFQCHGSRYVPIYSVRQWFLTGSTAAQRLRSLEENNRTINNAMRAFLDEITKLRLSMGLPVRRQPSFPFSVWFASYIFKAEEKIRKKIPYLRSDIEAIGRAALGSTLATSRQESSSPPPTSQSIKTAYSTPKSASHDTTDTAKVSLDDPTWKVLPAALKKHRINTEEWPNYEMFITFGPTGKHIPH